mmetsp:Transcript_56633/g.162505  ORF Transcript_56633/g.162505 Transcript_56633/m.162505 type:complete len:283 (+) Transcript_56633:120-968(+)
MNVEVMMPSPCAAAHSLTCSAQRRPNFFTSPGTLASTIFFIHVVFTHSTPRVRFMKVLPVAASTVKVSQQMTLKQVPYGTSSDMVTLSSTTFSASTTTCQVVVHLVSAGHIGAGGTGTRISMERMEPRIWAATCPSAHGPTSISLAPARSKYKVIRPPDACQSSTWRAAPRSAKSMTPKSTSRRGAVATRPFSANSVDLRRSALEIAWGDGSGEPPESLPRKSERLSMFRLRPLPENLEKGENIGVDSPANGVDSPAGVTMPNVGRHLRRRTWENQPHCAVQ